MTSPSESLRVVAATKSGTDPASRFRVRQLLPALRGLGVEVDEVMARPVRRNVGALLGPLGAHVQALRQWGRLPALSRRYDVTWILRELVFNRRTLERFTHRPRVLDVDDALFHQRAGKAAPQIAKLARCMDLVVCGNDYLAQWFSQHAPVTIIPTAVDAARFRPAPRRSGNPFVVGWIGTSSNFPNLEVAQEGLALFLRRHPSALLRVVADRRPDLPLVDAARWDFVPWSESSEVQAIQGFDVGIMPLADTPWNLGKCSFKMLQCMAVGLPVVVSPVGMNQEVLAKADLGRAATDAAQWADELAGLAQDADLRRRLGDAGRGVVLRDYDVPVVAPRVAAALRSVT